MNGHAFMTAQIELDAEIYPGMNDQHSLVSRQYFRCESGNPYVRHDLRIWDSTVGREARLKTPEGRILLGDAVLADWRSRARRGTARVRAYYDVHPSIDSVLTLDAATKNRFGDALPKIVHRLDAATEARLPHTKQHLSDVFRTLAREHNAKILSVSESTYLDHPAGGCRMGPDPSSSVCDSFGRTHDHANLFVVGSPTLPTAGCTNGTLTFAALTLRSADEVARAVSD
jgi:quinoprotein glucose dehydrogenase